MKWTVEEGEGECGMRSGLRSKYMQTQREWRTTQVAGHGLGRSKIRR